MGRSVRAAAHQQQSCGSTVPGVNLEARLPVPLAAFWGVVLACRRSGTSANPKALNNKTPLKGPGQGASAHQATIPSKHDTHAFI